LPIILQFDVLFSPQLGESLIRKIEETLIPYNCHRILFLYTGRRLDFFHVNSVKFLMTI